MFALRRVAVRALHYQPTRQLSTLRAASLTSRIEAGKPSLCRYLHQTRQLFAGEGQNNESPAEAQGGETVTAEPSAEAQKGIKEESIATSDVADAANGGIRNAFSRAAETVSNTFSSSSNATKDLRFPPDDAPSSGQPTKILYIGNLYFETTRAQLEDEFSRIGRVTNVRVVQDHKGMSKGFGYVEFANQEDADKAIQELDQKVFQGRRMAVQYHVRRESTQPRDKPQTYRHNDPSKTLFIGNMSYQLSDRDLNDLFREVKNVLDVRVAIDRRSGQPRGFAHADFIDVASAEKAKEYLSQKVVYGRQLRVDFSAEGKRSSDA